jgi:hypothetical protein
MFPPYQQQGECFEPVDVSAGGLIGDCCMKRRIALLDDWASARDARTQEPDQRLTQIADSIARMGYQVDIFTCQEDWESPESDLWQETVQVVHVPVRLSGSTEFPPAEVQEFAGFMIDFCERQERSYDLVHASFGPSGLVAAEIKSRLGIPFVMTFESPNGVTTRSQETGIAVIEEHIGLQDRVVREADGIIALSAQDRQELVSVYHADPTYILQISSSPHRSNTSHSPVLAWPDGTTMLLELYEDVLAVRRVALVQQHAVLLPLERHEHGDIQPRLIDHEFEFALEGLHETHQQLPAPAPLFDSPDLLRLSQRRVE